MRWMKHTAALLFSDNSGYFLIHDLYLTVCLSGVLSFADFN